jgi:hypothetical protein
MMRTRLSDNRFFVDEILRRAVGGPTPIKIRLPLRSRTVTLGHDFPERHRQSRESLPLCIATLRRRFDFPSFPGVVVKLLRGLRVLAF